MREDLQWDSYWGSAELSLVDAAEAKIGYKFPRDYRDIVSKFNGAFVIDKDAYRFFSNLHKSDAIYGMGLMHAFGENVDSPTETMEWALQHKPFGFQDGLVSFARDGGGNLLCFDYRNPNSCDDPAIVLWHVDGRPGTGEELSYVAPSFNGFLEILFEE